MSRRKEALCSIIGVDQVPAPQTYPEQITLPPPIHDIMIQAVAKTTEDGRERSIRIGYRNGQWLGGIMMRGTQLGQDGEADGNALHIMGTMLMPTQLYLHTHPSFTQAGLDKHFVPVLDKYEGQCAQNGEPLTAARRAELHNSLLTLTQTYERIPSSNDVRLSLRHPVGTVGDAVASAHGIFVSLRRNTEPRNPFKPHLVEQTTNRFRLGTIAYTQLEQFDEGNKRIKPGDTEYFSSLAASIEASRAEALNPMYVCYSSTDIFNPELHKIPVTNVLG